MTPDEIKEQMELCESDDRQLLTEEELSSQQNISHNSDNGYLYQDADFLCGAIIKTRKAHAEANRLLKKHQWVWNIQKDRWVCLECDASFLWDADKKEHHDSCAWDAALKGVGE